MTPWAFFVSFWIKAFTNPGRLWHAKAMEAKKHFIAHNLGVFVKIILNKTVYRSSAAFLCGLLVFSFLFNGLILNLGAEVQAVLPPTLRGSDSSTVLSGGTVSQGYADALARRSSSSTGTERVVKKTVYVSASASQTPQSTIVEDVTRILGGADSSSLALDRAREENRKLQEQLKQLQDELERLRAASEIVPAGDVAELEKEIARIRAELAKKPTVSTQTSGEITILESEVRTLEQTVASQGSSQDDSLSQTLRGKKVELEQVQDQLTKLQARIQSLEAEKDRAAEMEAELAEARKQLEALQKTASQSKKAQAAELATLQADIERKKTQYDKLLAERDRLDAEVDALKDSKAKAEAEARKLNAQINAKRLELENRKAAQAARDALQNDVDNLQVEIDALKSQLNDGSSSLVPDLTAERDRLREELTRFTNDARMARLQQSASAQGVTEEISRLRERKTHLGADINNLIQQIRSMEAAIDKAQSETITLRMQQHSPNSGDSEVYSARLQAEIAALQAEKQRLEERLRKVPSEASQGRVLTELSKQVENFETRANQLATNIADLEVQLQSMTGDDASRRAIELQLAEKKAHEADLARQIAGYDDIAAQIERLQADLTAQRELITQARQQQRDAQGQLFQVRRLEDLQIQLSGQLESARQQLARMEAEITTFSCPAPVFLMAPPSPEQVGQKRKSRSSGRSREEGLDDEDDDGEGDEARSPRRRRSDAHLDSRLTLGGNAGLSGNLTVGGDATLTAGGEIGMASSTVDHTGTVRHEWVPGQGPLGTFLIRPDLPFFQQPPTQPSFSVEEVVGGDPDQVIPLPIQPASGSDALRLQFTGGSQVNPPAGVPPEGSLQVSLNIDDSGVVPPRALLTVPVASFDPSASVASNHSAGSASVGVGAYYDAEEARRSNAAAAVAAEVAARDTVARDEAAARAALITDAARAEVAAREAVARAGLYRAEVAARAGSGSLAWSDGSGSTVSTGSGSTVSTALTVPRPAYGDDNEPYPSDFNTSNSSASDSTASSASAGPGSAIAGPSLAASSGAP